MSHICDMTHICDSFIHVTWLIHNISASLPTWPSTLTCHDSLIYITWLIRISDMTHSYTNSCVWHDLFVVMSSICDMTHSNMWLIYLCAITHPHLMSVIADVITWSSTPTRHDSFVYMRPDSFVCVTWLIYSCVVTHLQLMSVIADVTIHPDMSWRIHIYNKTHSYNSHDSFTTYQRDMTHSYEWHDSFVCVSWLIRMCDMTHSYV